MLGISKIKRGYAGLRSPNSVGPLLSSNTLAQNAVIGQDLYEEESAQPDGGLPVDADDQQADGQAAVEFCNRAPGTLAPDTSVSSVRIDLNRIGPTANSDPLTMP
jgi:hypothetical protein